VRAERTLLDSDFYRITASSPGAVIVVTRKPRAFATKEEVDAACDPVQTLLDRLGRGQHRIVVDTRRAVGRNDPDYESWFAEHRKRMVLGFQRAALVIATPVGMLHVQRLLRQDGTTNVYVFTDFEEAMRFAESTAPISNRAEPKK
jgi:hypothetical protein